MKPTFIILTILILTIMTVALVPARGADPGEKPATAQQPPNSSAIKNVGVAEFEKLRADKKSVVLDVRTPTEYAAGHIPGAINIDVNGPDFNKKISTLDTNKTYLVQCAAGVRSAKACGKLSQMNFAHLYNLQGGMKAWEKQGNKPEQLNDSLTK